MPEEKHSLLFDDSFQISMDKITAKHVVLNLNWKNKHLYFMLFWNPQYRLILLGI